MKMRNPTKKSEKRELGKDRWCSQMGQVGTGCSTWDRWDRDRWDRDRLETRPPVALGSSPELFAFTMSLAPPVLVTGCGSEGTGTIIRNCAESSNTLVPRGTKMSAIDVTQKVFFERLY